MHVPCMTWCINVNCAVKHIRVKLRHESGCTGLQTVASVMKVRVAFCLKQ